MATRTTTRTAPTATETVDEDRPARRTPAKSAPAATTATKAAPAKTTPAAKTAAAKAPAVKKAAPARAGKAVAEGDDDIEELDDELEVDAEDIDEERRLAYVAITRAKQTLMVTSPRTIATAMRSRSPLPSRRRSARR